MYYEFYLDLYFLENLMMNFFVLQMTGHVTRSRKPVWKVMLIAAAASLAACVMILLPVHRHVFLSATLSFFSGCAMATAGCGNRNQKETKHAVTVFWMLTFVMGGIWQFFIQILDMAFFCAIPAGYATVWMIWRFGNQKRKNRQYLCDVKITHHKREVQIKALLDSGNQLQQPGSGRPVHILDVSVVRQLLDEEELQELECMIRLESPKTGTGTFTYIPFRTIGNDHALMPMLVLETLHIKHGESAWNTKQNLAAVSKRTVSSAGEYQMILHPQILE